MPINRLDNRLVVVDDLDAVKAFFFELGLTLEGDGYRLAYIRGPDGIIVALAERTANT